MGGGEGSLTLTRSAKGREVTLRGAGDGHRNLDPGEPRRRSVRSQSNSSAPARRSAACGNSGRSGSTPGSWVGTIEFHGEEGYADVEATSAPANPKRLVGQICGSLFGSGSSEPGEGR